MARKKDKECPPEGAPAWMVTYGDMMTLLLTFFVLIVSFSSTEVIKFKAAMSSVQQGLGVWPESSSVIPDFFLRDRPSRAEQAQEFVDEMAQMKEENSALENLEVYNSPKGVRLILSDTLMFHSGSAILESDFQRVLEQIGEQIAKRDFELVRVEGHTDNLPISTSRFPSNWELSAARALSVVRFLADQTILKPEMLSGVGYGQYRPRASNETPEGRARNRRVEIFLEFEDPFRPALSSEMYSR